MSPGCISCVYRYAQEYVAQLWDSQSEAPDGKTSMNDVMPVELAEGTCEVTRKDREPVGGSALGSPPVEPQDLERFLALVADRDSPDEEIIDLLPTVFGELDLSHGIYAKLQQVAERNRAIAGMLSVVWLLRDRYEYFVECQGPQRCMSQRQWAEWQRVMKWIDLTPAMVHAMLVFIAIRGLGKVKSFAKILPRNQRSPEDVVLHLLQCMPHVVPCVGPLDNEMRILICDALSILSSFNLAQLLQGENTPFQVMVLRHRIEEEGEALLKFYLLGLVGVMCGLGGATTYRGSAFMDEKNGTNVLLGIQCLRRVADLPPHAIYWGYIAARARQLALPVDGEEQFALARLGCLCRASPADSEFLQDVWAKLSRGDRKSLTDHFLADGIQETAFVFTYLPLYLANAKANRSVGLIRALLLLIDLLEVLRAEDHAGQNGSTNVVVDLQEFADFARDVRSPGVFLAALAHSKVVPVGGEIQVLISTQHKQRANQTTWVGDVGMEMAATLRHMERKVKSVDASVEELLSRRHAQG